MINKLFRELPIAFLILFAFMSCEYKDSNPSPSPNPTPTIDYCEPLDVDTTTVDPDRIVFYYTGKKQKILLEKSLIALTIGFSENFTYNEILHILSDFQEIEMPTAYNVWSFRKDQKIAKVKVNSDNINQLITKLEEDERITFANQMFGHSKNMDCLLGITDEFAVKLKDNSDLPMLIDLTEQTRTTILSQDQTTPEWYMIYADKNSNMRILDMVNFFYETGKVEYVDPNLFGGTVEF